MKFFFKEIRIGAIICAAFCWWGIFYPELAMLPDTYRVVIEAWEVSAGEETPFDQKEEMLFNEKETPSLEEGTVQNASEMVKYLDSDIYRQILNTDRSKIRFKSKLWQAIVGLLQSHRE